MMITNTVSAILILAVAFAGMFGADISTDGSIVVETGPSFQLNGVYFGGISEHEYGHAMQQESRGDVAYYCTVALPSIAANIAWLIKPYHVDIYYNLPWEAEAIELGRTGSNQ